MTAVKPRGYSGYASTLLFWKGGPKFTIRCGACPATFVARIPMVADPTVRCPECGSWNELDLEPG